MTTPMNIVALSGIPGISFIAVTHGLGALPATGPLPINPLLQLGGAENEEWWQQRGVDAQDEYHSHLGYVRRGYGFDTDVAWELGEDPYGVGRPVSLEQFTQKILAKARTEDGRTELVKIISSIYRKDQAEAAERQRIVKLTITSAGLTYTVWKILPLVLS